jgi:antitoxin component YwqK of YwqJK toxin-antitoxin module
MVIPHPYAVLPSKIKDVEALFEGETQNGIPHGLCVLRFNNGAKEKDKDGSHAKEVFRKLNEDILSFICLGTMINGQLEGPATFIKGKGQVTTSAMMRHGRMNGWGKAYYAEDQQAYVES